MARLYVYLAISPLTTSPRKEFIMVPYLIGLYILWRIIWRIGMIGVNKTIGHITGIDAIDRLLR